MKKKLALFIGIAAVCISSGIYAAHTISSNTISTEDIKTAEAAQTLSKTSDASVPVGKSTEEANSAADTTVTIASTGNAELDAAVKQADQIAKARPKVNTAVGSRSASATDPKGFVLVSDVIPDLITEARYYTTYNFVGTRVDGYEEPVALCTREAAAALKLVADDLREKGYLLKIYDAYRPQRAVNHFCRWAQSSDTKMKKQFYPSLAKSSLFPTYIARKSGHSKGSTFDLTIVYADSKKEADMGGTFDFFGEQSHYAYSHITKEQAANRKLLHDAMVAHGFKPYSNEWWHFTLKGEPYPGTYFNFPVDSKLMK